MDPITILQNDWQQFSAEKDLSDKKKKLIQEFLHQLPFFYLRNFGDSLTEGVFICDRNGTILYVNKENERLTGIPAEECVGKKLNQFANSDGIANVVAQEILKTGKAFSSIAVSPITNIQMIETGSPIHSESGEMIGVIIIDRDISEQIQITENLKATEKKIEQYETLTNRNFLVINQLSRQHIIEQMKFSTPLKPESDQMKNVFLMARQAAATDVTVLLTGETGTGKEVIANYIYENSPRKNAPFIKVNCAAIPENLLESELFGYIKGAFTGADPHGKVGMFELAHTGTIFLDEIGELPLDFQAKLLRAIQQQEILRIGATKVTKIDVRIIAATNRNLTQMVSDGTFRADLYYRLNIFPILIPPLRERQEDIIPAIFHFLALHNKKYNKNLMIAKEVLANMAKYPWPGNMRELENLIERWVVIFDDYTIVTWDLVSAYFPGDSQNTLSDAYTGKSLSQLLKEKEKDILQWASEQYPSSRAIAKALHVDHSTIVRKTKEHGIVLNNSKKHR